MGRVEDTTKKVGDTDRPLTRKEKRTLAKKKKLEERQKTRSLQKAKRLIKLFVVIFVLLLVGYKFWNWINTPTATPENVFVVKDTDNIKGSPQASKIIIEYSDFQCPACASYSQLLEQVVESRDDVMLVYRHLPLSQIHPNAIDAAKAAEAAGKQDRFWEMGDILYDRQSDWSQLSSPESKLVEYAAEIGMDTEKFKTDFDSDGVEQKVFSDIAEANGMRLNSTPTFFINGEKVRFPGNVEGIVNLLE